MNIFNLHHNVIINVNRCFDVFNFFHISSKSFFERNFIYFNKKRTETKYNNCPNVFYIKLRHGYNKISRLCCETKK